MHEERERQRETQAVIFDMDGLMVDTEPLQFAAFRQQLWDDYGIELSEDEFHGMVGYRIDENWRDLKARHDIPGDIADLIERRDALYRPILEARVQAMPGVVELVRRLHDAGYQLAVASSSPYWQIDIVIDALGLRPYFAALASGEEVTVGKPDPAIYVLVAQRLDIAPPDCVALEDSRAGMTAAKAAGMHCIAVPNFYTRDQDLSAADLVLPTLAGDAAFMAIDRLLACE